MRVLIAFTLLFAIGNGCSESPTSPSGSPSVTAAVSGFAGTWVGTMSDPANGVGTLRLELTDLGNFGGRTGFILSWSTTYSDASRNGSGASLALIDDGVLTALLGPSIPPTCPNGAPPFISPGDFFVSVALSATGGPSRGTYLLATCTGTVNGTLELRKQ